MERKVKLVRFSVCIWNESHTFGIIMCKHNAEFSFSGLPAFSHTPGTWNPFQAGSDYSKGAPATEDLRASASGRGEQVRVFSNLGEGSGQMVWRQVHSSKEEMLGWSQRVPEHAALPQNDQRTPCAVRAAALLWSPPHFSPWRVMAKWLLRVNSRAAVERTLG